MGVLGPIAVGIVLLAAFVIVEGRLAAAPLVPLRIFSRAKLRAANIVVLALYSAVFAMWFFLSLYLQQVLGFSALEAGLAFLPMALSVAFASSRAPRIAARIGARWTLTTGMLTSALGLLLLTGIQPGGTYLSVLPGGMIAGAGLGLSLVPGTIIAVQGVPPAEAGLASGLLNTSRLLGGALGLAILTTIATSRAHSQLASGAHPLQALTDGYGLALLIGAVICAVGGAAAAVMLRERTEPAPHAAAQPAGE